MLQSEMGDSRPQNITTCHNLLQENIGNKKDTVGKVEM